MSPTDDDIRDAQANQAEDREARAEWTDVTPPHRLRVLVERDDLALKVNKLANWLAAPVIGETIQEELELRRQARQLGVMREYLRILEERIEAWSVEPLRPR